MTIAADNSGHVWVGNQDYFSVTELNAATGAVVRRIDGKPLGIRDPSGIAFDHGHVWVESPGFQYKNGKSSNGTVTEFDRTTGDIVRTIDAKADHFIGGQAIFSDGVHVWVLNGSVGTPQGMRASTVTELNAFTGALVRVIGLHDHGVPTYPLDVVSTGHHVFVTEATGGGKVVELDGSTGSVVRIIR